MAQEDRFRPIELGATDTELLIWLMNAKIKTRCIIEIDLTGTRITDAGLRAVAESCKQLQYLDVGSCREITDVGLQAVAEGCPQLKNLDLGSCREISDAGLSAVADGCNQLQHLYLRSCHKITDAGLRSLAKGCKKLHNLDLRSCPRITDAGLEALAEECKQLQYLHLGSCRKITDAALSAVAKGCNQLQHLNIGSCRKITDAGLRALAKGNPKLRNLNLWSCNKITDAGLQSLAKGCQQLQHLNLGNGQELTDAGLIAVAKGCRQLQYLNLGNVQEFTDDGLIAVATGCQQLRYLNLLFCKKITDAGLRSVAERCTQLKELRLNGTNVSIDPATLVTNDPEQIFAALRYGVALPVVRVLFVGTGNIGKSFLFERCFLDQVMNPNHREQTPDIELIRPERCIWVPTQGTQDLEPRVWDFGGQLVKHGVHETFLGDDGRSVYLLVTSAQAVPGSQYDTTDEETGNAIAYWLRMIQHFGGPTAPVIVAISQCDKANASRPIDVPFVPFSKPLVSLAPEELGQPFGVSVMHILDGLSSCQKVEQSIKPLRDAINHAIAKNGLAEKKVPPNLPKLRTHVDAVLPGFSLVSVANYLKWCNELAITDPSDQKGLRAILHHMGSLFYFGIDRDPDFRDRDDLAPGRRRLLRRKPGEMLSRYIINPAWLKQAVYQVFDATKGSRGWLSADVIDRKVSDANDAVRRVNADFELHPDGAAVVREFLELVELSHFDESEQKYLFPRGLERGFSGYDDWPTASLRWDFIPESAFHRFLVRTHQQNGVPRKNGSSGSFNHGRDWVECNKLACLVMVSVDLESATIKVRFAPGSKKDQQDDAFKDIHKEFHREIMGKEAVEVCGVEKETGLVTSISLPDRPLSGDAQFKLKEAFIVHHKYSNGVVGFEEPIKLACLADQSDTSKASASLFFKQHFKNYSSYRSMCRNNKAELGKVLKRLDDGYFRNR